MVGKGRLCSTLRRAAIWSDEKRLSDKDIRKELLPVIHKKQTQDRILNRELGNGLEVESVLAEVAKHYLSRALRETGGNKSKAARLVGLGGYQTVSNWIEKYKLDA